MYACMHAWCDDVARLPSVRGQMAGTARAARATCPECEGGRHAEGRSQSTCLYVRCGVGAAWRAQALLHEARMLKRLTYRSGGEQWRAAGRHRHALGSRDPD